MDNFTEILRIAAIMAILYSFMLNGEYRIRSTNIIAMFLLTIYGILEESPYIWIFSSVLIMIHLFKLAVRSRKRNQIIDRICSVYTYDNKQIRKKPEEANKK